MTGKLFNQFLQEMQAFASTQTVARFIIDVRDNGGGDSSILQPLINALKSNPQINRSDRLFVIVGRNTFSSALMNAVTLSQETNATLVGEPTGGKPNHFGDIEAFNYLTHS